MGGSDAPQGPDFNKLLKQLQPFIAKNSQLFKEAMSFGKGQFTQQDAWVDKLTNFGLDVMGNLNQQTDAFQKTVADRVGDLDKAGETWGQKATDIYNQNKQLAADVTGKLMPGMGEQAGVGVDLLEDYRTKGMAQREGLLTKLGGWDTTQRREDRAAQGVSDFNLANEAAIQNAQRDLIGYGIDPGQVTSVTQRLKDRNQAAILQQQIMNKERQAVEAEGLQYGAAAEEIYRQGAGLGLESVAQAGQTGRTIAEIARQPGADYLDTLAKLGTYGLGVGGLEQTGGRAAFDMRSGAGTFGQAGMNAGAAQRNAADAYGSGVYTQGANINATGADILRGGYDTSNSIYGNNLKGAEMENESSFGGVLGKIAGVAAPFVMDAFAPGLGTAAKAAFGMGTSALGGGGGGGGAPLSAIPWLRSEGGPVRPEEGLTGGAIPDDAPSMLTAGEYVLDRDTVRWFGEKHFANLQSQAKKGLGIPETAMA